MFYSLILPNQNPSTKDDFWLLQFHHFQSVRISFFLCRDLWNLRTHSSIQRGLLLAWSVHLCYTYDLLFLFLIFLGRVSKNYNLSYPLEHSLVGDDSCCEKVNWVIIILPTHDFRSHIPWSPTGIIFIVRLHFIYLSQNQLYAYIRQHRILDFQVWCPDGCTRSNEYIQERKWFMR